MPNRIRSTLNHTTVRFWVKRDEEWSVLLCILNAGESTKTCNPKLPLPKSPTLTFDLSVPILSLQTLILHLKP